MDGEQITLPRDFRRIDMTSLAARRIVGDVAARPSASRPFASARAALGRSLRGFGTAVELERSRRIDDPIVLSGLLRG
jgi:hypothetical protein